jgi:hypothetical protein
MNLSPNVIIRVLVTASVLLALGSVPARSLDALALIDSVDSATVSLPGLTTEQLAKIRHASSMELVYGDSTRLIRRRFSKDATAWDVQGRALVIPHTRPLPSEGALRQIRIKNPPNVGAAIAIGIPTGVLLTVVAATIFHNDSRPHPEGVIDFPTGRELALIGAGTFVVGPIVAYRLMGRWQSIDLVHDTQSGWRRAFHRKQ